MGRSKAVDEKLAVGYVRVSTDDAFTGPDDQELMLRRWAATRSVQLVAVHRDVGVPGATPLDRRPGLVAALAELRATRAATLIAASRCRFARDVLLGAQLEHLTRQQGARLSTVTDGADGDGASDQLRRLLLDVLAQSSRLHNKVQTRQALAARRAQGRYGGPHAPYGFRAEGGRLLPHPDERAAAQRAAQLLAEGSSLRAIGRALAEEGFRPRGRAWHTEAVRRLLEASLSDTATA